MVLRMAERTFARKAASGGVSPFIGRVGKDKVPYWAPAGLVPEGPGKGEGIMLWGLTTTEWGNIHWWVSAGGGWTHAPPHRARLEGVLTLKHKSGRDVARTLEFCLDKGERKLWSPQLKLPA